jgi:membrane-bound serine protease (ClpP class)
VQKILVLRGLEIRLKAQYCYHIGMSPVALRFKRVALVAALTIACNAWLKAQETSAERSTQQANRTVTLIEISGAIGPATADFLIRGIASAEAAETELVIVEMDTPGGLDSSMREIIQAILNSSVPVATFVSPQGARAASAGTYILYASHIAAMAPATNLGAATPVAIGDSGGVPTLPTPETPTPIEEPATPPTDGGEADESDSSENNGDEGIVEPPEAELTTAMERKAVNDAVAYIRSLAELRGRNADWAEQAVRLAESLSARQALEQNVIDVVARDLVDLLEQLDGWRVEIGGETITLSTPGLLVERIEPDWRTKFLAVISNPSVAYMLMLLGIYGLIFEGYNPGAIVPGVVGAIALLLALFSFQVLPVNYAGLALILLGVILMVSEFLVPSFGALGMGGIAAFVFGSVILIDSDVPGYGVSIPLITTIATAGALALMGLIWFAMKSRLRPVVSGVEEMTGELAEALEDFTQDGQVWIHGERWRARSATAITKGQRLKVTLVDGLVLQVEPVDP